MLGGGFIGCEVAAAAIQLGKRVTLLEALPTLLYRALGTDLGEAVAGIHRDEGVDVRTGQLVTGVRPRPGGGVRISTADGEVDADVLVVGVGTVPNTELAADAGLAVGDGISVDEYFATTAPGVYAIGDVAAQYLPGHGRGPGRAPRHRDPARAGRGPEHARASPSRSATCTGSGPTSTSTASRAPACPAAPKALILRGSPGQRSFSAFRLDGGRVRAVISLNRPKDVLEVRRLIARDHRATAEQLQDESTPLKRLAAARPCRHHPTE